MYQLLSYYFLSVIHCFVSEVEYYEKIGLGIVVAAIFSHVDASVDFSF